MAVLLVLVGGSNRARTLPLATATAQCWRTAWGYDISLIP
jgi:hypothetical protein